MQNKQFIKFIDSMASASGQHTLCESIKSAYVLLEGTTIPFGSSLSNTFGSEDAEAANNTEWTKDFGAEPPSTPEYTPTIDANTILAQGWLPTLARAEVTILGENPYFAYFKAVAHRGSKRNPNDITRYYCVRKYGKNSVTQSDAPMQAKFDESGKMTLSDVPGYLATSRYVDPQSQSSTTGHRYSGQWNSINKY